MRTITLDTFGLLNSAQKHRVALPPTILALRDFRVHVCSSNSSDVVTYVEASNDEHFGIAITLYILYINLDNCHVGFWGDFDNSKL